MYTESVIDYVNVAIAFSLTDLLNISLMPNKTENKIWGIWIFQTFTIILIIFVCLDLINIPNHTQPEGLSSVASPSFCLDWIISTLTCAKQWYTSGWCVKLWGVAFCLRDYLATLFSHMFLKTHNHLLISRVWKAMSLRNICKLTK